MLLKKSFLLLSLEILWLARAQKTPPIETPGDKPPYDIKGQCLSAPDRCLVYCTQGPCPSKFDDELLSDGSFFQTLSFGSMGEIPNNRSYEICNYSGDFNGAGGYKCIYDPAGKLQPFVYDPVYKDMANSYSSCPRVGRTGRNFYCTDGEIYRSSAKPNKCIVDQAALGATCDLLSTVGSVAGVYCGGFETVKGALFQLFNLLIAKLQDVQPNQDPKDKEAAKFQTLFFLAIAAALGVATVVAGAETAILVEAFGSLMELICVAADTLQVAGSLCAYVSITFPKECYLSKSKRRSHLALDAPFLSMDYGLLAPRAENLCTTILSQLPVTAEQCANIPAAPKCVTTVAVLLENGFNQTVADRIVGDCPEAAKARNLLITACKIRQAVVDFEPYCGSINDGGNPSTPHGNNSVTSSLTTNYNSVVKTVSVVDLLTITACPPEVKDCPARPSPVGPKIEGSAAYTTGAPAQNTPYAKPEGYVNGIPASSVPAGAGDSSKSAARSSNEADYPAITATASVVQFTGTATSLVAISIVSKLFITLVASVAFFLI